MPKNPNFYPKEASKMIILCVITRIKDHGMKLKANQKV
jgi:hypothetical protein